MDRRNKHLSSDVRGVIFAEHNRGGSQRSIGALLRRRRARSAANWRVGDKKTAPIVRTRRGLFMMVAARDADASASGLQINCCTCNLDPTTSDES